MEVSAKSSSGNEPTEVGHVNEEHGIDFVCNRSKDGKVEFSSEDPNCPVKTRNATRPIEKTPRKKESRFMGVPLMKGLLSPYLRYLRVFEMC